MGATLISTKRAWRLHATLLRLCQCPERGDTHFYAEQLAEIIKQAECVNALKGATLISTEMVEEEMLSMIIVSMP